MQRGDQIGWLPGSYLFCNLLVLTVGVWAIASPTNEDASQMVIAYCKSLSLLQCIKVEQFSFLMLLALLHTWGMLRFLGKIISAFMKKCRIGVSMFSSLRELRRREGQKTKD